MKATEAKKIITDGVEAYFQSERFAEYLKFIRNFKKYSFYNTMLILCQRPDASMVAGYKKWQELHRHVKKGEQGIGILCPIFKKVSTEIDGVEIETEELAYFKSVCVFDIAQTDGEPIPTPVDNLEGGVKNYDGLMTAIEKIAPMSIEIEPISRGNGYCSEAENRIVINSGMSEAQTVKTAVHELAHSLLHVNTETDTDRETAEIEAESVAFLVCDEFGIDTSSYSFPYIATWSKSTEMGKLSASMNLIVDTADSIIKKIKDANA